MAALVQQENTCELHFSNLHFKIKKKEILKDISGQFPPASLIAVIGPSGGGKTTLLNILSAYSPQNASCDYLQVNGVNTNFEHLRNISCYITQDIHLNDLLTVEENMCFAADFKLGVTHSQIEKNAIITELLDSFGLSTMRTTRAGKLSSGERKRLALAQEMISDPKIIYLDEPTTGLDISSTYQTLAFLKKIAARGKTVICTIHQVCASHFNMFDFAYVIADGQCAYQGRPQDLVMFLHNQGMPCNIHHNPADYFPMEMELVKREVHNRYYTVGQYYMSVFILDLPISTLTVITSNMLIYYLTGQPLEQERVILFIIVSVVMGATTNAIGFCFGTLLNFNNAIFLASCTQVPLLAISGFAIMPQDIPYLVDKFSQLMYVRTGANGFLVAVFGLQPRKLNCPAEAEYCFYSNTHRFMKELQIDPNDYTSALYVLAVWCISVRVITYYTMRYRLSLPIYIPCISTK
ncbi:ATP-binding cassette subfamily G member 4-like [Atheta coriaria]|uniref:ATP-binding cassette subfamily G member 4-like n=1 Tax=Dalotia coriaria TaxID=877792 RepID=UPI0031F36569